MVATFYFKTLSMSVLGRSRTGDLPLRRRLLYPLSYEDVLG